MARFFEVIGDGLILPQKWIISFVECIENNNDKNIDRDRTNPDISEQEYHSNEWPNTYCEFSYNISKNDLETFYNTLYKISEALDGITENEDEAV